MSFLKADVWSSSIWYTCVRPYVIDCFVLSADCKILGKIRRFLPDYLYKRTCTESLCTLVSTPRISMQTGTSLCTKKENKLQKKERTVQLELFLNLYAHWWVHLSESSRWLNHVLMRGSWQKIPRESEEFFFYLRQSEPCIENVCPELFFEIQMIVPLN